jgi:hypothetical protein
VAPLFKLKLENRRNQEMKKILFAGILFACLLPIYVFSQSLIATSSSPEQIMIVPQHITILPQSVASAINCCVLPFNRIFVGRLTEILWNNQSESNVKLTIGKGNDCKEISMEGQLPYVVESIATCHVIQNIPQGKTRTVRLADPGTYDYTIEYLGTLRKPETGSITVF